MDSLGVGFILLLVGIVVLIVFRQVTLWYFRINEVVTLLERIHTELRKSNGVVVVDPPLPGSDTA